MKKKGLLAIIGSLLICTCTGAATIQVVADGDTYIDSLYPDANFGQQWKLLISGSAGKPANCLLHFGLGGLPQDAIIGQATLTVCVHGNRSTTILWVHPLLTTWQENFATWYTAEAGTDWATPGGDFDQSVVIEADMPDQIPGWIVLDVTALITDEAGRLTNSMVEQGLFIKADDGYNKLLSAEFEAYENAQSCHSCHGLLSPDLDTGKSTNCAQCHSNGNLSLQGKPALTLEYQTPLFQFVQISDVHVGRSPLQLINLNNVVDQINETEPAFVLVTGDLTENGAVDEYAAFKEALSALAVPYYCIPGDNDILDGEGDLQRYHEQLGNDYYAFDYRGLNIVGINNCLDPALDEDQLSWLEQELQAGGPELVFGHKPLLAYRDAQPLSGAEALLSLYDSADVLIYMNGNDHVSAEHSVNGTHHIWSDNLSYAHDGDPYNLFSVYRDRVLLYHVDLRDGSRNLAGVFPLAEPPTLVTLAFFQAVAFSRTIDIRWQTESEIDNVGFNLYRAEDGGEYRKITADLIPARGSATEGAHYRFIDEALQNRTTYQYRLEDIDVQGRSTFHGPVSATPKRIPARSELR